MILADAEALLRLIAATAAAGAPLPPALRASGLAGADRLAAALDAGADLPAALAGTVPDHLRHLLTGDQPPLDQAALLAAGAIAATRQGRAELLLALAQPIAGLLAAATALALVAGPLGLRPDWRWIPAGAAGMAIALLPLAVDRLEEGLAARLPLLGSWGLHRRRAWRYERAALVARWRLPEERLALLGADLIPLGPVLARPDAEEHCRRLAAWHTDGARRAYRRLAWMMALGLHLIAATLILAAAAGPMQDLYQGLMHALDG